MPTDVNVYDVILEDVHTNKEGSAATSTGISPAGRPDNASSDTVTIREMLAGVKDADGEPCCQRAWHGAAKKIAAFSLDYGGTGSGGSAHAHGKKRLLEINALIENAPSGEALCRTHGVRKARGEAGQGREEGRTQRSRAKVRRRLRRSRHGAMKSQQKEEPQMAQNPRERVSRVIRSH